MELQTHQKLALTQLENGKVLWDDYRKKGLMDPFPDMEINIELAEDTDLFQAQMQFVEAIKSEAEKAGQPLTIEQWETLKIGQENAAKVFFQLANQEIAKLKEEGG